MRSKKLTAGLAAAAALTLPFIMVSPAAAATLPAGDSLYAITCDYDSDAGQNFSVLYSVNPADAQGTVIGSGTGLVDDCAGQAAYNPVTGESFYVSWRGDEALARIDLTTGAATIVANFPGGNGDALAIGKDGTAYATVGTELYRVNLADASLTLVGNMGLSQVWAFSVDPVTGLFYAITSNGDAYRVDVVTGALISIGSIDTPGSIYSLQIDTSGAWWIEADSASDAEIYTGPQPAALDTAYTLVGLFDDNVNEYTPYTESLLITYPKALAATGMDSTVVVGAGTTAALLLLMGGAVLALRRRRTV